MEETTFDKKDDISEEEMNDIISYINSWDYEKYERDMEIREALQLLKNKMLKDEKEKEEKLNQLREKEKRDMIENKILNDNNNNQNQNEDNNNNNNNNNNEQETNNLINTNYYNYNNDNLNNENDINNNNNYQELTEEEKLNLEKNWNSSVKILYNF